jgi:hypothetical protein
LWVPHVLRDEDLNAKEIAERLGVERTRSNDLARADAMDVACMTTAQRAWSIRRRGSRRAGKNEPERSFAIRSSTSPAFVLRRRLRLPLRWVVRSSVRSYRPARIAWADSSSTRSWRTIVIASRRTSSLPPARIALSRSEGHVSPRDPLVGTR